MAYRLASVMGVGWGGGAGAGTPGGTCSRGHGGVLLAGLLSMAYLACFLKQPRITFPGVGAASTWPGPLTSIINPENVPQANLMEAIPRLRLPLPGLYQVDRR